MKHSTDLTVAELNAELFGTERQTRDSHSVVDSANARLRSAASATWCFLPGRPPQVERFGELTTVPIAELPIVRAEDTAAIARDLIRDNEIVLRTLKDTGSTDLSYALPDRCRFRVNVFRQRGTFAIVMRMIAQKIPSIAGAWPAAGDWRLRDA